MHARLLGHSVLGRSFDRPVRHGDVKFQTVLSPVRSAAGQSKTGTCEQGFTRILTAGGLRKQLGGLCLPHPLALFTTERQRSWRPRVGFFKTFFKQRSMKIEGSPFYGVIFRLLSLSDNIIVCYFVPLFSLTLTLYSKIQAAIIPYSSKDDIYLREVF